MTGTWACEKKNRQRQKQRQMRGFFAPLRMTSVGYHDKRWGPANDDVRGLSRWLEGGEDDGYDYEAEEEASAVGDGVDDGVFVELAAGGEEPETADP
jgi:hypothetical protein